MKSLIWAGTIGVIAIWSFLAWAVHTLIGVAGQAAASNADVLPVPPEAVELVSWLAVFGSQTGEWIVIAVWAIVSLLIAASALVATRLLGRQKNRHPEGHIPGMR